MVDFLSFTQFNYIGGNHMKKILSITLTLTFVFSLVFGAVAFAAPKKVVKPVAASALKDGIYKAEYSAFDVRGYKESVVLTIKGGKIVSAQLDAINSDPTKLAKSKDPAYEKSMSAVNGVGPKEYIAQLNKALVASQNPDKLGLKNTKNAADVDTITGATSASDDFKILVKAALANAKKGTTKTVIVPAPAGK
jgi:major membrane immunogen (membrane-anchored lipoprotein)